MRICPLPTRRNPLLRHSNLRLLQQTLSLLLVVVIMLAMLPARPHLHALCSRGIRARRLPPHLLGLILAARAPRPALNLILVHSLERPAHAQEQHHEPPLGELCVVDQVCVDHVLQVAAAVVRQQDVDCFRGRIGLVCLDGVVYRVDDVWVRGEERVRFDFLQREADALLAEGAPDLFQSEQLLVRIVLD
jgi:hypothetical protein